MSDYLTAKELSELTGYKPNQRAKIRAWLDNKRWRYVVDSNQMPVVLRKYRDMKLGVSDDNKTTTKYSQGPDFAALGVGAGGAAPI